MKPKSYGLCPYQIMNGQFYVLLNKTSEISYYNFFKGKIEENETIEECAQREFFEETGVEVNIKDFEEYYEQNSKRKNIGIFLVDWAKYHHKIFKFQDEEIWSAVWVPLEYIEMSKNQQKIINDINLVFTDRKNIIKNLYSF